MEGSQFPAKIIAELTNFVDLSVAVSESPYLLNTQWVGFSIQIERDRLVSCVMPSDWNPGNVISKPRS